MLQPTDCDLPTNPFATRWTRPGAMPFQFAEGRTIGELVVHFKANGWRGAIVGPHGTGKSTLVSAMVAALEASGRRAYVVRLRDGQRRLPLERVELDRLDDRSVLVIDGYEQLGWWHRRRVLAHCRRCGCGVLVTSHRECGLPVLYRTGGNLKTVQRLIEECLPPHRGTISALDIEQAFCRHGGNVREVFFELYDVFEARRAVIC